jgi:hypothetical protein
MKQSESRPVFGLNRACIVEVVRGHPSPYGGVAGRIAAQRPDRTQWHAVEYRDQAELTAPPRVLASCLGMDRKGECEDGSRMTWSAAEDIASWACGRLTWSCSQMM